MVAGALREKVIKTHFSHVQSENVIRSHFISNFCLTCGILLFFGSSLSKKIAIIDTTKGLFFEKRNNLRVRFFKNKAQSDGLRKEQTI